MNPPTKMLKTSVLLEMGTRGGTNPSTPMLVSSLVGELLSQNGVRVEDYPDLAEFTVQVLHPGRTLLEKLSIIHVEAGKLESDDDALPKLNLGRHFYDVHQLLLDPSVIEMLSNREETLNIILDVRDVTIEHFYPDRPDLEIRPDSGFATSPAFDIETSVSRRFRKGYEETMPQLFYGKGSLPAWQAICERVQDASDLI